MFVDAIRLFPPSYQALAACGKHGCPDHEGFSACFPSAIRFVSRRDRFSPALLLWVSQAVFSLCWVLNVYHPFLTLNQEANTTGVLLTIDNPVECIVRLTYLPPFPATCPGTIRSWTVLLCYAGCVPMTCSAHSLHRKTVSAQLRFLLSTLFLNMKHDTTDRFMRDAICGCYGAERFFLLHHTLHDGRPQVSGNTIVRMFRPWSSALEKRRVTTLK